KVATDPHSEPGRSREGDQSWWPYLRAFIAPVLIWVLLLGLVLPLVLGWVRGQETYDCEAIQEWIDEARNPSATLADLVELYVKEALELVEVSDRLAGLKAEVGDVGAAGVGPDGPEVRDPKRKELIEAYLQLELRDKTLREALRSRRQEIAEFLRALG